MQIGEYFFGKKLHSSIGINDLGEGKWELENLGDNANRGIFSIKIFNSYKGKCE